MLMRSKRANNSKNSKIWSNCSCLVHVKAAWAISSLEPSTKVQLENNKTRIKNCKLMTLIRKRQILRIMLRFKKVWAISVMRNATLITRLPRRRKTRKTPVSTSVSRTLSQASLTTIGSPRSMKPSQINNLKMNWTVILNLKMRHSMRLRRETVPRRMSATGRRTHWSIIPSTTSLCLCWFWRILSCWLWMITRNRCKRRKY